TLHHLLTKQDPRLEPPFSFAERPLRKLNPGVTAEFDAIVATALNYNPTERFGSAQAMKEAVLSLRRKHTGILTNKFVNPPQPARPEQVSGAASPTAASSGAAPSAPAAPVVTPTSAPAGIPAGVVEPIWRFKCEDEVRGTPLFTAGLICVGAYDNNLYGISAQ